MIRTDNCPFGLNIPSACKCAGKFIEQMSPIDENKKEQISSTNRMKLRMLVSSSTEDIEKCKFAAIISDNVVECNAEDSAPGVGPINLNSEQPLTRVMNGTGIDGAITFPEGWITDSNLSRNTYYGQFSLQGSAKPKNGAGFAIFCPEDNTIFLLLRDDGRWGTPGGKANGKEYPLQTAFREADEEIGNLPDLRPIDYVEKENENGSSVTFICELSFDDKQDWIPELNKEHLKWEWFNIDNLPSPMHSAAERVIPAIKAIIAHN